MIDRILHLLNGETHKVYNVCSVSIYTQDSVGMLSFYGNEDKELLTVPLDDVSYITDEDGNEVFGRREDFNCHNEP